MTRGTWKTKTMAAADSSKQYQHHHHLVLQLVVAIILCAASHAATQPKTECPTSCGSVDIPFPFGITEDCSLDSSFLIDCNKTTATTTTTTTSSGSSFSAFLPKTNFTVLNISLDGELRISSTVASDCYDSTGKQTGTQDQTIFSKHFHISSSRNKLMVVGCDTIGMVLGEDSEGNNYTTGCLSLCNRIDDTTNGSCAGTGCCQIAIHKGMSNLWSGTVSMDNHTNVVGFNPCGYTFVVEDGKYEFVSTDLRKLGKDAFPVVMDWSVGNLTCEESKKNATSYACKAEHSECYDSTKGPGYLCNCSSGLQGNPYIHNGCHDVDECTETTHDCYSKATCNNTIGSFNCLCPEGYEGDGKNDGTKCSPKPRSNSRTQTFLIIALSVSVGALALLLVSFYVYWGMKKKKLIKLKEKYFEQNGGLLLQQLIERHKGTTEMTKVFTVEELKNATDNFDETKILGQGGQGTVYKGLLLDNRTVAIKMSKISDSSQIEQFINEVAVLYQINHRNVVKLLGCCLETQVPLLVYEFIPNGTISDQLHDHSQSSRLTWKTRLRIASETAGALAYLHSATSIPIVHRDVKTTNILLDQDLTAKVSDFGASRIIPLDQSQLTTLVQGTLGYLDPEYFHTSQLTEKSDVYSFGVVLAELITGRKALSFDVPEAARNLAQYFVSSLKEDHLLQIVDKNIIDEAKVEQLIEVANIARQCLRVKGEERPTMKEVAMELEGLRIEEKHKWESDKRYSEETENLLGTQIPVYGIVEDGTRGSGTSSGFDSMSHIPMSLGGGR